MTLRLEASNYKMAARLCQFAVKSSGLHVSICHPFYYFSISFSKLFSWLHRSNNAPSYRFIVGICWKHRRKHRCFSWVDPTNLGKLHQVYSSVLVWCHSHEDRALWLYRYVFNIHFIWNDMVYKKKYSNVVILLWSMRLARFHFYSGIYST